MKNGFTGGMIIDYPNSKKAKKYYLFLMAGYSEEIIEEARNVIMPKAKTSESDEEDSDNDDSDSDEENKVDIKGKKKLKGINKKEKYRNKDHKVKTKGWI